MELLISTSLVAAFVAGVAALFAPCCVTVLLPSYFGSIFETRRKVFLMTFIFFLGILTVFLPLGLGFSSLSTFFGHYHHEIFTVVGLLLLALGVSLLFGKRLPMPSSWKPKFELKGRETAASVYVLGIFSGIATTCCAPVLAGALALSILPGSFAWGIVYTLAYVLGMVTPLFILATIIDRTRLTNRLFDARKPFTFTLFGKEFKTRISDLLAGGTFTIMGVFTLVWAANNPMGYSATAVDINILITQALNSANRFIGWVPQFAWAIIIVGLLAWLTVMAVKQNKEK